MWRAMLQREALDHAITRDDARTATRLLRAGIATGKRDGPFRQMQLVKAAYDVNPETVAALLDAGADPNVESRGKYPLIEAIRSDAILRYPPMDETTHPKRRFDTVQILLNRGANPNLPRDRTPLALAQSHGLDDIVALLRMRGATSGRDGRVENLK